MRFEFINPFAEASHEILSNYLKNEITTSDISLRDGFNKISGVGAILGLNGESTGNVLIDMSEDTACKVASVMNGTDIYNFTSLAMHTIKELVNQISGLAVTKLAKDGFNIGVTPPIIVHGTQIDYQAFKNESLHVRLETSLGNIDILIAITEDE